MTCFSRESSTLLLLAAYAVVVVVVARSLLLVWIYLFVWDGLRIHSAIHNTRLCVVCAIHVFLGLLAAFFIFGHWTLKPIVEASLLYDDRSRFVCGPIFFAVRDCSMLYYVRWLVYASERVFERLPPLPPPPHYNQIF